MGERQFELRIKGDGVSPETVDVGDLLDVIAGLRDALAETAGPDKDTGLFLIGIEEGSDKLLFEADQPMLEATKRITYALNSHDFSNVPVAAHRHLRQMWKAVFDNGWDSCEFNGNGSGIGNASIKLSNELFPEQKTIRGRTTVYGRCQRVGGEQKKSATIKLLDGTNKSVRLKSKELALQLGKRLYQTIGLEGEGIWNATTLELQEFRADTLSPFRDRSESGEQYTVNDSLKVLSEAAGNRWDNVNADEFVEELRRD